MGFINQIRGRTGATDTHVIAPEMGVASGTDAGTDVGTDAGVAQVASEKPAETGSSHGSSRLSLEAQDEMEVQRNGDKVTDSAQLGVQKAEAAALVWSKGALYATYAWVWVCFFMLALQQSILSNVTYYAYSSFQAAPQIATASILASIVGGVLRLPIAKVLNVWGRAEGFVLFLAVYLVGMVVIASCNGPDSYAAGYVFYWIGYDALYFIMDVFVADTSGLKNRAFAFAFVTTPFICTAFTGPLAATAFLQHSTWRWAVGAFCIIQTAVFLPLAAVFKYFQRKAERQGLFVRVDSGRTALQSAVHYVHEFDVVGALLLMAAWVLFLLPFSLNTNGRAPYGSATFIAMLVVGVLLFPVFYAWERYVARVHFIRWELFKSRTVVGACLSAVVVYYSFYAWDLYYYYFVMVVYDLDTTKTGYMAQIYNVGSCFWGPLFGLWVRWTGRFKYASLGGGVGLMLLGSGLMIHFRGQDANIGYIVMCQIFIAFGGGTLVIGNSMAVMSAADRDGVPMLLALLSLANNVGGSIGYAVAESIYTNTFPGALRSRLPDDLKDQTDAINAGGYLTQMTYAVGSPARDAINYAWGYSQRVNCISSTAFLVLGIPAVLLWKNYSVDRKQNKGTVL